MLRPASVAALDQRERNVMHLFQVCIPEVRHRLVEQSEVRLRRTAVMPGVVAERRIAARERRTVRRKRHRPVPVTTTPL